MDVETNTGAQGGVEGGVQSPNGAGEANTHVETKNDSTGNSEGDKGNGKTSELEALIQKAVDRATNKLGNENKSLRKQLDDLQKEKLSDDELKQLEIKQREEEIAEREKKLKEQENRFIAIKAIKEIGLDDGSDMSLALVDFVMADDETAIKDRVKSFDALVKRFVQAQVDKTFKNAGRTPGKGNSNGASGTENDSIAVSIGKKTAEANKASQSVLEHYTGGSKR